jgi:hypothetical protein
MCEAIPPLPHTSSWCGAELSAGTILPLPCIYLLGTMVAQSVEWLGCRLDN